ncbi:MAG: Exopolyphosphatase [Piccolia ochrophora]|nr:MAG: Exopolyphosphatase [Piccolia ochrophora]
MSVRAFLSHAKSGLQHAIDHRQRVNIVVGNESADLDSLASSILYAYIRSTMPLSHREQPFAELYVPLTNIPSEDVQIRPEFLALLSHANLDPSHLITLDDLSPLSTLAGRLAPQCTKWVLVDHNALQGQLGQSYGSRVRGVVDHHDDENLVPADTGAEPRIITPSGSCSSLVTAQCREAWDSISNAAIEEGTLDASGRDDPAAIGKTWDAQLAKLTLAAILIDTTNLTSKSKVTPPDQDAVEYLEGKILASPEEAAKYDRKAFFNEMQAAKQSLDSLRLKDILRKDYKEWLEHSKRMGVSSVVKPLGYLMDKAAHEQPGAANNKGIALLDAVRDHARNHDLSICVIMTSFKSEQGKHRRELFIWAFDADGVAQMKRFTNDAQADLQLRSWDEGTLDVTDGSSEWRRVWRQNFAQASRKQVAPRLRQAMQPTT